MSKERLVAFSDGVLAIIITIMVLELKPPHSPEWRALLDVLPVFLAYALSFAYVAIYWNNHHHMFQTVERVTGAVLWANNHLLFWLSLVPFTTAWAGENDFARQPTILFGVSLLMPAIAFYLLQRSIIGEGVDDAQLKQALGGNLKGKLSPVFYVLGIAAGFVLPAISYALYALVALMWIIPDPRIERAMRQDRLRDDAP